jgi:hypothetical protein
VFCSQSSGIVAYSDFHIHLTNSKRVLVFLHDVNFDACKIQTAVNIIDELSVHLACLETSGSDLSISSEMVEKLNAEYSAFLLQRQTLTKTVKSFEKMIADLEFPSLETYLKSYYPASFQTFECKLCTEYKGGKTKSSLAAHMRRKHPEVYAKSDDDMSVL